MSILNTTTAHIDFNEWLAECPVQWFQQRLTDESVVYKFILPDTDEDESDA